MSEGTSKDSKLDIVAKLNSYWDNLDYTVQMTKEELQWFEAIRDNDNILAAMKKQFPEVFV